MNKQELKEKWGKYTDTDKLVDDIRNLLSKYSHRNSEYGVCKMLDTYFTNKEPLIKLLAKSTNYRGDMRIVMRKEFERDNDRDDIKRFVSSFRSNDLVRNHILKSTDSNGKTMFDYMKTGIKHFTVAQLNDADFRQRLACDISHANEFDSDGHTKESHSAYSKFYDVSYRFIYISTPTISVDDELWFTKKAPELKFVHGQKTARAFNRLCDSVGLTSAPYYNKEFAKYADMVSGLVRNLDYVISVNPYDYLTMSFGVNWASCHTIDKRNIRRSTGSTYSGAYCGGTLSYMLDQSSIITYVVGKDENPQTSDKIYRNMFHYQNNVMIQGRIYPQGNDGSTDLYAKFRDFMQTEFASLLELTENKWIIKRGTDECRSYSVSTGAHYKDYLNFGNCNACYPKELKDNIAIVNIGHYGICPYCGELHDLQQSLSHSGCYASSESYSFTFNF